jgi:TRAP-type mannitol/chloroaromatic compound transport system permease small subunit
MPAVTSSAEDPTSRCTGSATAPAPILRTISWSVVGLTFVYLLNCYLSFWQDWPSVLPLFSGQTGNLLSWVQLSFYVAAVGVAGLYAMSTASSRSLRHDSERLTAIAAYIIRAAFWGMLLVGIADALISFLRVEGLLIGLVGEELNTQLGRSRFRGPYVHFPLIAVGMVIAAFRQGIDFIWLALLVVVAELAIVITRFIFSYEQAFMGDLVRFWYAALFLFASAYTLYEDGHVRVDVFYAGFSHRGRGRVNAVGAVVLGMVFCWTILTMGMWNKSSILITPLMGFEVSQSGFGMYVKYLMASFLSIFAISMMIQFAASLLESAADYRGDPGARQIEADITH